ncbi:MAG: HAD family hydrolase [Polyangia bacterium]
MKDAENPEEIRCPHCGKPVDRLRAGAVSIVDGRIAHFCSSSCREAFLDRDRQPPTELAKEPRRPAETERPAETKRPAKSERPTERPTRRGSFPTPRLSRPILIDAAAIAALVVALLAALLLPFDWLSGMLPAGIAIAAAATHLSSILVAERRSGAGRISEAAAVPLAAAGTASVALLGYDPRLAAVWALALLATERLGRLLERLGRHRSGVLDVVFGKGTAVASEWRDNSTVAERIRRVLLVLMWLRYPLAASVGFAVWSLGSGSVESALLAGATALVACNTRALRMSTGDAHLSATVAAARRAVTIRDAHAVDCVGASDLVLFIAARVLVEPEVEVVDWRTVQGTVQGEDENAVLDALGAAEACLEGRIAEAIRRYVSSRGRAPTPLEEVETLPGVGIAAETAQGRLLCGTRELLLGELVSTAEHEPWAAEAERTGRRALFVALEGRAVAVFAVEETPLENVPETMRRLSALGVEPAMVTSAEVGAASALASRMGIEHVRFGVRENELHRVLDEIRATGLRALLVGHGPIFEESFRDANAAVALGNEGPSLAGVDAGRSNISEVARVVEDAKLARRSARTNLVATAAAAALGLGLASGWHAPPIVAVAGAAGFAAAALCTLNGPYPQASRLLAAAKRLARRLEKRLGLRRSASP